MPGFVLHQGATVTCMHGGQARVSVSGTKVTVQPIPYTVAGCTLPPPTAGNGPCVTAQWVSGATRVTASGQPLLVQSSQAICAPTGTGVIIASTQTRVRAT